MTLHLFKRTDKFIMSFNCVSKYGLVGGEGIFTI